MEAVSEVFWQLVELIIAIDLNSFLGGIHHHMAFVAPMEVLIQFESKVIADLAVKVIGQLF
jgi:hypothetical protein